MNRQLVTHLCGEAQWLPMAYTETIERLRSPFVVFLLTEFKRGKTTVQRHKARNLS